MNDDLTNNGASYKSINDFKIYDDGKDYKKSLNIEWNRCIVL